MLRLVPIGSFFVLALAAGCSNGVDHASAVKVMNLALAGTVAADGQVVTIDVGPGGGKVDVALTNPLGSGSANATGTIAHSGSVTSTKLDVELKGWTDPLTNVTLNGSLHEVGSFSSALPLAGDVKLSGALAATGDILATVDFDLHGSYGPAGLSITGDVGGQSMKSGIAISVH